jgi:ribosomal protein L27
VKRFGGEEVRAGNILLSKRYEISQAQKRCGKDFTLFAEAAEENAQRH